MKWFGPSWGAPMNKECPQVDAPVGESCVHCEEPIAEGEPGIIVSNGPVFHLNCFLRGVYGSAAHIIGLCSCYVDGSTESDPPSMTRRQAADLAVATFDRLRGAKPQ